MIKEDIKYTISRKSNLIVVHLEKKIPKSDYGLDYRSKEEDCCKKT